MDPQFQMRILTQSDSKFNHIHSKKRFPGLQLLYFIRIYSKRLEYTQGFALSLSKFLIVTSSFQKCFSFQHFNLRVKTTSIAKIHLKPLEILNNSFKKTFLLIKTLIIHSNLFKTTQT